jgi:hypothetical protein
MCDDSLKEAVSTLHQPFFHMGKLRPRKGSGLRSACQLGHPEKSHSLSGAGPQGLLTGVGSGGRGAASLESESLKEGAKHCNPRRVTG